jgi:hypothetical protein
VRSSSPLSGSSPTTLKASSGVGPTSAHTASSVTAMEDSGGMPGAGTSNRSASPVAGSMRSRVVASRPFVDSLAHTNP